MHVSRQSLQPSLSVVLSVVGACVLSTAAAAADVSGRGSSGSGAAEAQYHILAGEVAAGRNQPLVAAEEFLKALEFAPDAALAARATSLALASNNATLALSTARKWLTIEPTSLEAREVITRLSLRAGLTDQAYEQCVAIVKDHPGGLDDGLRHVSLLLAQEEQQGPAALALIAKLVAQYPKRAGAWQAQGLLALRFGDIEQAEKSARESLRLDPSSKEAPLLLTGALVRKGDIAGADQIIDGQTRNNPIASDIRLGYARLLIESNQREHARLQLTRVLKGTGDNTDALYLLGLINLDEGKVDEAEPQFRTLVKTKDRANEAHYYLGRIAEQRGRWADALSEYTQVNAGNQVLDASVRRAEMLYRTGKLDEARVTLEQLRRQYPPLSPRFYLAEGQLLNDAGTPDEALLLYSRALEEHKNEPDLLYARSLVFERLKRLDEAEADLRTVLTASPADARALNALGFMLVVHSSRLDEAEKLIAKALEITPEEPAVIDSMGWLRFRQGRQSEALLLLARAYEVFPDPEVAAHFGEALWVGGDRGKAQAVWERALQASPNNGVLRETIKRLMP